MDGQRAGQEGERSDGQRHAGVVHRVDGARRSPRRRRRARWRRSSSATAPAVRRPRFCGLRQGRRDRAIHRSSRHVTAHRVRAPRTAARRRRVRDCDDVSDRGRRPVGAAAGRRENRQHHHADLRRRGRAPHVGREGPARSGTRTATATPWSAAVAHAPGATVIAHSIPISQTYRRSEISSTVTTGRRWMINPDTGDRISDYPMGCVRVRTPAGCAIWPRGSASGGQDAR